MRARQRVGGRGRREGQQECRRVGDQDIFIVPQRTSRRTALIPLHNGIALSLLCFLCRSLSAPIVPGETQQHKSAASHNHSSTRRERLSKGPADQLRSSPHLQEMGTQNCLFEQGVGKGDWRSLNGGLPGSSFARSFRLQVPGYPSVPCPFSFLFVTEVRTSRARMSCRAYGMVSSAGPRIGLVPVSNASPLQPLCHLDKPNHRLRPSKKVPALPHTTSKNHPKQRHRTTPHGARPQLAIFKGARQPAPNRPQSVR